MNTIQGMNDALNYMEEHLEDELDTEKLAEITGYSPYHFQRLFMMLAGVPLSEYIRRRRLSKAAAELQAGSVRVLDAALKYGYSSPNSFHRAFKAMHGIPPGDARKKGAVVKAYPPLSFEVLVHGGECLTYRLEDLEAFRVVGMHLHTTVENGQSLRDIEELWSKLMRNGGVETLLPLMNAKPMGLLGVSDYNPDLSASAFDYTIGVSTTLPAPDGLGELVVPAATFAVFPCGNEGPAAIRRLQKQIVMEWLATSGFEFAKAPDLELYFQDGSMEIWLPVRKRT